VDDGDVIFRAITGCGSHGRFPGIRIDSGGRCSKFNALFLRPDPGFDVVTVSAKVTACLMSSGLRVFTVNASG
jgi:hypothetical protein